MKKIILSAFSVLFALSANAATYNVDYKNSSVEFAGKHAGEDFKGKFNEWTADIVFDAEHLDTSHLNASFELKSASTGNAMYDGTLPSADWFNVAETPKAEFKSSSINKNADGSYTAKGDLTIRNITKPAEFNFILSDISKEPITGKGSFKIDRLAYDIGKKSDAKAEWVSQSIDVTLNITANISK